MIMEITLHGTAMRYRRVLDPKDRGSPEMGRGGFPPFSEAQRIYAVGRPQYMRASPPSLASASHDPIERGNSRLDRGRSNEVAVGLNSPGSRVNQTTQIRFGKPRSPSRIGNAGPTRIPNASLVYKGRLIDPVSTTPSS